MIRITIVVDDQASAALERLRRLVSKSHRPQPLPVRLWARARRALGQFVPELIRAARAGIFTRGGKGGW